MSQENSYEEPTVLSRPYGFVRFPDVHVSFFNLFDVFLGPLELLESETVAPFSYRGFWAPGPQGPKDPLSLVPWGLDSLDR